MAAQENERLDTWRVWWLAIRPKTLPASASGVIIGSALAWADGSFRPVPALVALCVALLLQIGSNVANDVYDFERGADTRERQGPQRVTQAGWLTPEQMKRGLWAIFGLAVLIGLYLVFLRGWGMALLGLAAIACALLYTGGPFPLAYYGLGDVFVFIFFGLVAVCGTYYVQAGSVSANALRMSIPIGLIITDILVVNNLRDLDTDRAAGKHTTAVRMGQSWTRIQYCLFMALAFLLVPLWVWLGMLPVWSLLLWLSLPLAWNTAQTVLTQKGRPLNAALAGTGQLALAYSVLFLIGMLLSGLRIGS
jgi:1,4-dihydroxy-2-naphthoate octaprenyltransferase